MLLRSTANCGTMAEWFKAQGRYHSYTETPERGDVVFFDWDGKHTKRHHTGIVLSVSGSTVTTVEGNTALGNDSNGGAVMKRDRGKTYITGYGRPNYATTTERELYVQKALAEVGVKESPANSNKVRYNTWFYGKEVSGSAYPWCAVFVSWVFNSSGVAAISSGSGEYRSVKSDKTTTIKRPWLQRGDTAEEVKAVQRCLYSMGFKGGDGKEITVDGSFGANTEYAVKRMQKANSLASDGVVGDETNNFLFGAKGGE